MRAPVVTETELVLWNMDPGDPPELTVNHDPLLPPEPPTPGFTGEPHAAAAKAKNRREAGSLRFMDASGHLSVRESVEPPWVARPVRSHPSFFAAPAKRFALQSAAATSVDISPTV
jgi:hypothetical protein